MGHIVRFMAHFVRFMAHIVRFMKNVICRTFPVIVMIYGTYCYDLWHILL